MQHRVLFAALCLMLTMTGCHEANTLDCRAPRLVSTGGDLKESADDVRKYQERFASGLSDNVIAETVASLRIKYPDADSHVIANYLVASYCPLVAAQVMSLNDKRAKLATFASAVHAVLGS